jgi:hypothetical protein
MNFIISDALEDCIKKHNLESDWQLINGNQTGYDFVFGAQPIEQKFSLNGIGFVGSSHSTTKVDKYFLGKLEIENNKVVKLFLSFLNLAACHNSESNWSHLKMELDKLGKYNQRTAFSNLKIHREDADKFQILHGKIVKNRKWCKEVPVAI